MGRAGARPDFGVEGSPVERLGRPLTGFGIAGAFYLGGGFLGSERARRVGAVGAAALAANGLLTVGVKTFAGRQRPMAGAGAGSWDFLGGNSYERSSFPSGHTSMACAMASVVADEYDSPWADALSYSLAGTVAASRIHQDQHWASDVAAGAALGFLVGKGLSRWERSAGWARFLYSDGSGLYFKKRF